MAFQSYTNQLTGDPQQVVSPNFLNITLGSASMLSPVVLEWSFLNPSTATPFSRTIVVSSNTISGNQILLPSTRFGSLGQSTTIVNNTSTVFNVCFGTQSDLSTYPIGPTQAWDFYITSQENEEWGVFQSAASSFSVNATSLAGNGLSVSGGKMEVMMSPKLITEENTDQVVDDWGSLIVFSGDTASTYSLLPSTSLTNGFLFSVVNSTDRQTSIVCPQDDSSKFAKNLSSEGETNPGIFTLEPQESSSFIYSASDNSNLWYSLGFGQRNDGVKTHKQSSFNVAKMPAAGFDIKDSDISSDIFVFYGKALSTVPYVPVSLTEVTSSLIYQIYNSSNVPLVIFGASSTKYNLPPGKAITLIGTASGIQTCPSFVQTTLSLDDGTVQEPSLSFQKSPNTGMCLQSSSDPSQIAISVSGIPAAAFQSGQILAPSGAIDVPGFSFIDSPQTGIYFSPKSDPDPDSPTPVPTTAGPSLNFSVGAKNLLSIILNESDSKNSSFNLSGNLNVAGDLFFTGVLPIKSGGTGARTPQNAALNIFPKVVIDPQTDEEGPPDAGCIIYYNGTDWTITPPPQHTGQYLFWVFNTDNKTGSYQWSAAPSSNAFDWWTGQAWTPLANPPSTSGNPGVAIYNNAKWSFLTPDTSTGTTFNLVNDNTSIKWVKGS